MVELEGLTGERTPEFKARRSICVGCRAHNRRCNPGAGNRHETLRKGSVNDTGWYAGIPAGRSTQRCRDAQARSRTMASPSGRNQRRSGCRLRGVLPVRTVNFPA
jgi:hypothetical protein